MAPITTRSVREIRFEQRTDDGTLTIFQTEQAEVPFPIRRVFMITGVSGGGVRGDHAHRGCTQLLACLAGRVTVEIRDGRATGTHVLTPDGQGLQIPPMLWNAETFEDPSTVLAVFCDELYDPGDYIRDWDEYVRLKAAE
jgi:UDP-2-acetamido-3-amino-2,3-dideoxy-glucuronate N-acetyltransferase